MTEPFTTAGGAMLGWVNASGGLAKLTASAGGIDLRVRILGRYTFKPESVVALKRLVWIPLLAQGIRIQHSVPTYPEQIIFWSWGNPDTLLENIRDSGFEPKAAPSALPVRRGLAIRWLTIIVALAVWSGLFQLGQRYSNLNSVPGALGFPLLALLLLFIVSFLTPRSQLLQRMAISPGRHLGEVRPLLNLFALISGLFLIVLGTVIALGGLR